MLLSRAELFHIASRAIGPENRWLLGTVEFVMAQRAAAIAKGSAGDGNELPLVTGWVKRKLDHAMTGSVARLAMGLDRADFVEPGAAGADDEVTHAARVGIAIGIQSSKAFVNMIVAGDGDVRSVAEKNFD